MIVLSILVIVLIAVALSLLYFFVGTVVYGIGALGGVVLAVFAAMYLYRFIKDIIEHGFVKR